MTHGVSVQTTGAQSQGWANPGDLQSQKSMLRT